MPPEDQSAWERLGKLLAGRRIEIGARYKNKNLFAEERQINRRMLWQVESGERDTYRTDTLRAIEAAYALVPGSLERTLAGGDLEPAALQPDAPSSPRLAAVPEHAPPQLPDLTNATREVLRRLAREWPEDSDVDRRKKPFLLQIAELKGPWEDVVAAFAAAAGRRGASRPGDERDAGSAC